MSEVLKDPKNSILVVPAKDNKTFKKNVMGAMSDENAMPHFAIWHDKRFGWCLAAGNSIDTNVEVRKSIKYLMSQFLADKKLL